jgi:hypothetical protein
MGQPELYTRVVLVRDVHDAHLKRDDTAMYIDYVPVSDGEDGAVLEVFNALGKSIAVVTVPISAITSLQAEHIPAVRSLNDVQA